MGKELRFDGRVAIVTGAGGGLGRSHALLFASRGAKVVVNDLGGTHTGEGKSQSAADKVVEEIHAAGGEAVANYNSVEDGQEIVKTALDTWGRLDILINNAGILRDVSFPKMTQQDWDLIYRVHVLGSYRVTQAAWPVMRDNQYGRIIMTASAAGIYGNFGQANYSMAKLGLLGFSNTLSIEGKKRNILVNTIAPIAGSRMTETVLPPELLKALKPEYVSALVALLCHEGSEETGGLFEVGGGFYGKLRWERSSGKIFRLGRSVSPEDVKDSWQKITQFEETTHPATVLLSMQPIMDNVEKGPSKGGSKYIDVDAALGYEMAEVTSKHDERDISLYALGVGAAQNPLDERDLQLVYELHGDGMKALPTFGVVPALNAIIELAKQGSIAPGLNFGLDRILHGEQYLELKRPLPAKAKLSHRGRVKDIFDKGKNALVITELKSYDEEGVELARNEVTLVVRGGGGWGGERGPSADINVPPDRAPDATIEEKIPLNQALLYRLSGDINPLHADPGFAQAFGFDRPILHGLCTFGFAGRHVVQAFAPKGDPDYFKSIKVRFAESVFPGETLCTEMWKESDTRIVFRSKVKERDKVVISNAAVELYTEVPKPQPKPKAATAKAAPPAEPTSADIFGAIGSYLKQNPDLVAKVKTVFQFKLTKPESVFTVDLRDKGEVSAGATLPPGCTLELSDADFMAMCTGKADPMKLFSSGKLKISGDIMASQKLEFLKKIPPQLVLSEMQKRTGAAPTAAAPAAPAAPEQPTGWDIFIAMRDHVERSSDLVGKVKTVYLFKLKNPDSAWTLDLKNAPGSVVEGETQKPDCTLEIAEADFISMATGKANPMKLFSSGKLKISGDIMASQKLEFLTKIDPEKAKEAVLRARAAGQGPGLKSEAAPASSSQAKAKDIFTALQKRLEEKPGLATEVAATVQFQITEPPSAWVCDFSAKPPAVREGTANAPTATFTLRDEDLASLARGEESAKKLHQRGSLRVDGDVRVAHRVGFLKGLL